MKTLGGGWKWAARSIVYGAFGCAGFVFNLQGQTAAQPAASLPVLTWIVAKPIPVAPGNDAPDEATQKKAFDEDLLADNGGEGALQPKQDEVLHVRGQALTWAANKSSDGLNSLRLGEHKADFAIAYAYSEFTANAEAKLTLGLGSDDAIKVWLNGKLVHEKWAHRPLQPDEDIVPVAVKAGVNRLVLKIQNGTGDWGFACRFVDADVFSKRLVEQAWMGDVEKMQPLIAAGADVNSRTFYGITPLQAARFGGRKAAADFLLAHGADAKAETPPDRAKAIDAFITQFIATDDPGLVVRVSRDGKVLFERAYGLADVPSHQPLTVDTKLRIGSVTKQFTASAILKLQEQGKLSIEDPLAKYYPDFPHGKEITLHHLLTHTSGIHGYTETPGFSDRTMKPIEASVLIDEIKTYPLDFNPGDKWAYSNSGYFILGTIVEKASGKSYDAFLQEVLFDPADLAATGVYHNAHSPTPGAKGYSYSSGDYKPAPDWDMSWAGGAGAIYSTAGDLDRWNQSFFGNKILTPASLKASITPVVTRENRDVKEEGGYGFGRMISVFRGTPELSHGGGLPGFLSQLSYFPEKHVSIAVIANSLPTKPQLSPPGLARKLAELYFGDELPPVDINKEITLSDDALHAIVGRYDAGPVFMTVTLEAGHAFVKLGPQRPLEIFPKSETEFFLKAVDAQLTFTKDATGKVTKVTNHQGGMVLTWLRVEEPVALKWPSAKLDAVVGRYDFGKHGVLEITREGDSLFSKLGNQPKLRLHPSGESELSFDEVKATTEVVTGSDGKVTKLVHHQGGQTLEAPRLL